jgi:transposase InsO family protein
LKGLRSCKPFAFQRCAEFVPGIAASIAVPTEAIGIRRRVIRRASWREPAASATSGSAPERLIRPLPIDPVKPWQNGDNESFNGKFRDECLSMQWFRSLEWFRSRTQARVVVEIWRRHYNAVRPHSSSTTARRSNFAGITRPPNREPSSSNRWSEIPGAGQQRK